MGYDRGMSGDDGRPIDPEFPHLAADVVEGYRNAPAHLVAEIIDGELPLRHASGRGWYFGARALNVPGRRSDS